MSNQVVSNAEKFLAIYNELDAHLRRTLKYKPGTKHSFMLHEIANHDRKGPCAKYLFELLNYAKLRNAIIHNPNSSVTEIIAEPHPNVVARYQQIRNEIVNPPQAYSICIKAQNIYRATPNANVIAVIKTMSENRYNYVPVVDNDDRMLGIFSPNVLLSYLVSHKDAIISPETTINKFKKHLPFKKHQSEYFEFVPNHALLADVQKLFEIGIKQKKRLAVVFITANGNENDELVGMITAWDIAKNK